MISHKNHTRYDCSGRGISPTQRPVQHNKQHSQETDIQAPGGIRTYNTSKRAAQTHAFDHVVTGTCVQTKRLYELVHIYSVTLTSVAQGQCSRYSDSLRAEQCGIPTPVADKKLYLLQPPQSSYTVGIKFVCHR